MKAIDQLRDEHAGVRVLLAVLGKIREKLERGEKVDPEHLEKILEYMKVFIEQSHHKKEEGFLFPALLATTISPATKKMVKLFIEEHINLHEMIQDIARAVSWYSKDDPRGREELIRSVGVYIRLLTPHEERETNILFEMADKILPAKKQAELQQEFKNVEDRQISVFYNGQFQETLNHVKKAYLG